MSILAYWLPLGPLLGFIVALTWIVLSVTIFRHVFHQRCAAVVIGCSVAWVAGWITLNRCGFEPHASMLVGAAVVSVTAMISLVWSVMITHTHRRTKHNHAH